MYPHPNAKVEFICNDNAVCSIDEERVVSIPLANFVFPPFAGQEIFLGGRRDIPRLCTGDDLFDRHPIRDRELDGSLAFAGCPVR